MKITFKPRPHPIDAKSRINWLTSVVGMIIFYSRAQKSSVGRIHIVYSVFIKNLDSSNPQRSWVRLDPSINTATNFLIAEKLVTYEGGRLSVSIQGKAYLHGIAKLEEFSDTAKELENISKSITEAQCTQLMKGNLND